MTLVIWFNVSIRNIFVDFKKQFNAFCIVDVFLYFYSFECFDNRKWYIHESHMDFFINTSIKGLQLISHVLMLKLFITK